jgi:hypothetical protein
MITSLNSMTEDQINAAVSDIVASLGGTTERDFVRASEEYNSVFFRGLPPTFVKRACAALSEHFISNTNNYWVKQSQLEYI